MSYLFNENDDFDDTEDLPKLHFKKVEQNGKSAHKKDKKKKLAVEDDLNDSVGGKFVMLHKAKDKEILPEETPLTKKSTKKERKRKRDEEVLPTETSTKKQKPATVPPARNSKSDQPLLKDKLVVQLKGSRFRFLNELMYSSQSSDAVKLFNEDPTAFTAYHEGYRQQIAKWPMNPLQRIIKSFKKIPKSCVIADFGCGDALLSKSLPNKVYSLDLVAANEEVIECDMAKTPLEKGSIDVAVYCLSLMGTNLMDFFAEANRVLKANGHIKIAEVSSRFQNVNHFIRDVQNCGFEMVSKDLDDKLFYFFNFKKVRPFDKSSIKVKEFSLAPCLYKKR